MTLFNRFETLRLHDFSNSLLNLLKVVQEQEKGIAKNPLCFIGYR